MMMVCKRLELRHWEELQRMMMAVTGSDGEIAMMAATTLPLWEGGDEVVQAREKKWFNMGSISIEDWTLF